MLPGLMVSLRPVSASSERGNDQKAPGMRGKKTNNSKASGIAYNRASPASRKAARLSNRATATDATLGGAAELALDDVAATASDPAAAASALADFLRSTRP